MAPLKNTKALEKPPKQITRDDVEAESSSSGEYETDSESESGSDSETVEKEPPKPVAATKLASVALKRAASEDEEESSSEESESDSETKVVALTKNKKAAASSPPVTKKRSASGEGTSTAVKRAKTVEESGVKKSCIIRKWEDEDEIKLLKALIDFNADEGKSPFDNMKAFFEPIQESFTLDPTLTQVKTKIRVFKDKYKNRIKGKEKKGVEPPFANDHEKECMILADLIWGRDAFADLKSKKAKKKAGKEVLADPEAPTVGLKSDWINNSSIVQFMVSRGLDEGFIKQEWSSASTEDKKIIEVMYKSLHKRKVEFVQLETKVMDEFASRIFKST